MSIKRRPPQIGQQPTEKIEEGDIAVLDRENETASSWRPSRIERRDWRGEGVVSLNHTD